ncbi:MAG: hypothetical protein RIQ60_4335 [Pseudomonadota bacterium]|jgi:hypothetical protein
MMTKSLQFWLAVAGGLVLAGLVIHSIWQARRAGGSLRAPSPPPQNSRLFEPTFADASLLHPGSADPSEARLDARNDSTGADALAEPGTADVPSVGDADLDALLRVTRRSASAPKVDALIDAVVGLGLETPLPGEAALAHLPASRRAGSKPFLIEGRNTRSGEWEALRPSARYVELQAGVQLASRNGAINEIEYSEFIQKVQAFADAVNASTDFPDMLDVVARGRELDTFAVAHDAQLAMRLRVRRAPWPVAVVNQHAARHGFVPGMTAGRLVLPGSGEGAPPVLSLLYDTTAALADDSAHSRLEEITLVFDVPQTAQAEAPFNAWCAAGRALALSLDAAIFDDAGRELHPEALPQVGEALADLYDRLAERDLAAGSPAARRLFS